MKKALGAIPAVFPMPVLMIATYDENGKVNVMNAAWGMISDMNQNYTVLKRGPQDDREYPYNKGIHSGSCR